MLATMVPILLTLVAADPDQSNRHNEPSQPASNARDGLAVAAGKGNGFAGYGLQVHYYWKPTQTPLFIAPYVGGGGDWVKTDRGMYFVPGWATGVAVLLGERHRALLRVGWGKQAGEVLFLHGSVAGTRGYYGVCVTGGYEFMSGGGFFSRTELGAAFPMQPKSAVRSPRYFALSVGLGYKLW